MSKNGNKVEKVEKRGRGVSVSIKQLVEAMLPIIEKGNPNNTQENLAECAKVLQVAPSTVLNKIRKFRRTHPQFNLIDSTYFTGRQGPAPERYTEQELDEFFAQALGKSVGEIRTAVASMQSVDEDEEVASEAS
jgi:hypothetical protein